MARTLILFFFAFFLCVSCEYILVSLCDDNISDVFQFSFISTDDGS